LITERVMQFLSELPGISGYKERERRRELDKRIRQSLMEALEDVRSQWSDLQLDVLNVGGLRWMDDMERINSRLTLLADKVRSAAYGYRPIFDLDQVQEAALDRLLQFDRDLLKRIPTLGEKLKAARAAAQSSPDAFGKALNDFREALNALLEVYDKRDTLIRTGEAKNVSAPSTPDEAAGDKSK